MTSDDLDPELLAEVRSIHADAKDAREQLGRIEQSRQQDRRILNRISVLSFLLLLALLLGLGAEVQAVRTASEAQAANRAIRDCTVPTGQCFQRNAILQSQLVLSLSYQTQAQQLVTSLRVAQATGNAATIPVFQQRQQETADVLQEIKENVIDINNGKPPRHEIPTELPIADGKTE